ncbi:hypothetical protein Cgig2_019949 [Carnegiea gigantea]|uniref:Pectinesterase n=1 Tax=Carnegiea gigantea TaxID=171969 RepID=A0A9Q1GYS6_9CARY|nr:hypothetical protein Cgig2_019949 [Carnegiea gigantea]
MAKPYEVSLLQNPSKSSSLAKIILTLALSLAVFLGIIGYFASNSYVNLNNSSPISLTPMHVCDNAHEPFSCLAMVTEVASRGSLRRGEMGPLQAMLGKSMAHIENAMKTANDVSRRTNDPKHLGALDVCTDLLDISMDRLSDSIESLGNGKLGPYHDAHAWLSGVLTNYITCLDGLDGPARSIMENGLNDLIARGRATLAMLVALSPKQHSEHNHLIETITDKFPTWVTSMDRKLLEAVNPNVVVAQDGSGKYKTVSEAVAAAPANSKTRYVIYVKKGTYKENVQIGKTKKNIMLMGDGMASTIITGSLNFMNGTTTYKSATVAVDGDGFMAQDIWFQNSAGPQNHQAVALRVSSDQAVINRCQIDAYQDTLYAHSLRQFYRDCQISGTVDFIFGNAAVVFQNCKIVARKPMAKQFNAVTAQGREDPNQPTGTSLQNCQIVPSPDLQPVKGSIKSYLGRPWKNYSRTAVMQSFIDDHIDPSGWVLWDQYTNTKAVYYGEYANKGPGAETGKRVNWAGFHVITNVAEARKFTVSGLIQGDQWLQSTGVTFSDGL